MMSLKSCATLAVICSLFGSPGIATEKKLTTYERQTNLMKRINEAQKSKELTVNQAKDLRKDLSRIAAKKQKNRDAKNAKNTKDDASKIEERLTETSEKIDKQKLENREKDK